jgi:hypothetical protein
LQLHHVLMCAVPTTTRDALPDQIDLIEQAEPFLPGLHSANGKPACRDRLSVELRGLGPQLRAMAAELRISSAVFVRRAVQDALRASGRQPLARIPNETQCARTTVKVTLRLSSTHASSLTARAREAEVAQGAYVAGLLDDAPPPPLAPDHSIAIEALMKSSHHLAAMSSDLNAFLRMVGRVPSDKLNPLRERLQSLMQDVRSHLALSAALMSEIKTKGRPKR